MRLNNTILKILLLYFFFSGDNAYAGSIYVHTSAAPGISGYIDAENRLKHNPNDLEALRQMCNKLTIEQNYKQVIYYAKKLLEISENSNNEEEKLRAYRYLSQSYLGCNQQDSAKYTLDRGLEIWNKIQPARAEFPYKEISSLYNNLGIYTITAENDYHKSIPYFQEAIRLAKLSLYTCDYMYIAANLVRASYMLDDPAGLDYALEVYRYGKEKESGFILFTGAISTALMFYMIGDYEQALPYIEEGVSLVENYYGSVGVYNLYANILYALGENEKAEDNYRKALLHSDITSVEDINTCFSYGKYLYENQRYKESARYLEKGIQISTEKKITTYRYKLYETLSQVYTRLGNYGKALDYYVSFHHETDSIHHRERERAITELKSQYEENTPVHNPSKYATWIIIPAVMLFLIGFLFYQQSHHKKKSRSDIPAANEVIILNEKYSASSLTDEKGKDLFRKLEKLMHEQHIYCESNLTIERAADMIGTNRTYLSQIINEETGLSFNYYVNQYRIEEAIRLLSDPRNDTPLKAMVSDLGIKSLSTFYKLFREKTGMTPTEFRQKVQLSH